MNRQTVLALLPDVIRRTDEERSPTRALLEVIADALDPVDATLLDIDATFDPQRTPDSFVAMLARWVDLEDVLVEDLFQRPPHEPRSSTTRPHGAPPTDADPSADQADRTDSDPGGMRRIETLSSGHGQLRQLIAEAVDLARWRGTREGLQRFLTSATGVEGFVVREPAPFRLVVELPAAALPHRALIEQIVRREKPAFTQHEISP